MNRIRLGISARSAVLLLLGLIPSLLFAAPPQLPPDMHAWAIQSIDCVYREDFKQATAIAKQIIRKYPDHPAGYFFQGAVLNTQMEYLQSEKFEAEFYRICEDAVARGERLTASNPSDVWVKFFTGGANGAMGTYESRYDKLVTAFKHGWGGVSVFKDLSAVNADFVDVQFGIASYDYWRSAMTKNLWWMPGVTDKREPAVKTLFDVANRGIYVKESACAGLIDILYNEKRYADMLAMANRMLAKYPDNLFFRWGRAKALVGLKELDKAETELRWILARVEDGSFDSNYHSVMAHCFLQKTLFLQKRFAPAIQEYEILIKKPLSPVAAKRLAKILSEAADIDRRARQGK